MKKHRKNTRAAVKVGTSRQIAIPKKLHDQLGLSPGDYLEVRIKGKCLIFTPKALIGKNLSESFEDYKNGRVYGPFATAKEAIRALHAGTKGNKKRKAS